MPHFVLNIEGDPNPVRIDLPSVNAAKCEALRYASKTVCDDPEQFWSTREFQVAEHLAVGAGGLFDVNFIPGGLAPLYGGHHPTGSMGFLRFKID